MKTEMVDDVQVLGGFSNETATIVWQNFRLVELAIHNAEIYLKEKGQSVSAEDLRNKFGCKTGPIILTGERWEEIHKYRPSPAKLTAEIFSNLFHLPPETIMRYSRKPPKLREKSGRRKQALPKTRHFPKSS